MIIKFINHNNDEKIVKIKDVLYVPEMMANLLSVKKLTENEFEVLFKENNCEIKFQNVTIALADAISNLYILRKRNQVLMADTDMCRCTTNCLNIWHRKLGHRDNDAIKLMCKEKMALGIDIKECAHNNVCEVCIKGKMSRLKFPKVSSSSTNQMLDLVHSDVCGPMESVTPSKNRYFVTFIDDFTRYCTIYLMHEKSEVAEKFIHFVELVKTKFGKKPVSIRSDRGGEYVNKKLQEFLLSEGIKFEYTAPYSPQQNGVSERKNRYLVESARCMLIDANLDKKYWGEAISTANYIQNRLPSRSIKGTPHELWFGEKPNLEHLQIFVHMHMSRRRNVKSLMKRQ